MDLKSKVDKILRDEPQSDASFARRIMDRVRGTGREMDGVADEWPEYPEPLDPEPIFPSTRSPDRGLIRRISAGEEIPIGFGVATIDFLRGDAVCIPIPFNILVRWALLLFHSISIPRRTWWEKRLLSAEARGYQRGHDAALSIYKPDGVSIFTLAQVEGREEAAYWRGRNDLLAELEKRMDEKRNPPEEPVN